MKALEPSELTAETKRILNDKPHLLDVWLSNLEAPVFPSNDPAQTEYYMGDGYIPTFLFEGTKQVEYNAPEDNPDYTLLIVADDRPATLTVGNQVLFDYSDLVNLPEVSTTVYEDRLAELESQLDRMTLHLRELNGKL